MSYAYTPGLSVASATTVRSVRRLPLVGEVVSEIGNRVQAEDIVAKTDLPGNVRILNVANLLSIEVAEINEYMLKNCLLYTSPSPRDGLLSRMPSSA